MLNNRFLSALKIDINLILINSRLEVLNVLFPFGAKYSLLKNHTHIYIFFHELSFSKVNK